MTRIAFAPTNKRNYIQWLSELVQQRSLGLRVKLDLPRPYRYYNVGRPRTPRPKPDASRYFFHREICFVLFTFRGTHRCAADPWAACMFNRDLAKALASQGTG